MIMYVGHIVSLTLYVAVVFTALSVGREVIRGWRSRSRTESLLSGSFAFSLLLQSSLFLGLQIDWIFEDHNNAVGDVVAYAWLAFDYFNGFALLTFATALRIHQGWK